MKSFAISLAITLTLLCAIIVNSVAVTRRLDAVLTAAISLPDEISGGIPENFSDKLSLLSNIWYENLPLFELTLTTDELRECSNSISCLFADAEADNPSEYASNLASLRRRLSEMRLQASLNPKNLI